ncbi:hypothetical protein [Cupriavidus malaysiensis]|uniref:Uncharacterized protein n=1 Tax=Cupriavidus malaysiensis TaxID=367825 RepID=A0ABM6FGM3_9BURK|nr:hypothetical protein [Cupriavidus malaysiensis]AOZ11093.1 hypothetical protein BKK80_34605 [Cupriavidus malaysiensis]
MTLDIEKMLHETIPGGSVCDPQKVCDAIREWAKANSAPTQQSEPSASECKTVFGQECQYAKDLGTGRVHCIHCDHGKPSASPAALTDALHYLRMGMENLALGNGVHMVDFRNAERILRASHCSEARDARQERTRKPALDPETHRLISVIAGKIEDGTLFKAGIYSRAELASIVRHALSVLSTDSAAERDVLAERPRQVEAEGWTPEHEDEHSRGELAMAASCYAIAGPRDSAPALWPWAIEWWKPGLPRRNLEKAGALILAEIERRDRAAMAAQIEGGV